MINYLALKNRCYPVKTIALDLFAHLRLHGMKQWTELVYAVIIKKDVYLAPFVIYFK